MKKNFRFLAIILVTLLLISSLPLAAFAYETEDTEEENDTETVEETTAEQEETHESDLPAPPSSEENDNVHYELLPNGLIQATVYSGTGGIDTYDGSSSLIPGQIEFTDPSQGNDIMAGGSSNSEINFDSSGSLDVMVDTYIEASNPSVNYGYSSEAVVSTSKIYYIQSPLPDFPEGATVVEAALRIAFVYDDKWESIDVNAHRVTGAWTESVLTWNVAKGMTRLGLEQRPMSITTIADPKGTSLTTPKYTTIDITAAASAWASGEAENYGVALKTSTSQQIIFKTSEAATAYRPCFVYTFQVPNPYSDGTYFIRNVDLYKHASIDESATDLSTSVQLVDFYAGENNKWKVHFCDDGYYTIKSALSGKYIGVDPANTSTVKLQNTLTNYTKWSIIETASGNYKLKCKATATTGYVLSSPSSDTDLIMTLYTEDQNYSDEWEFIADATFGDLVVNIGESKSPNIQSDCIVDATNYIYIPVTGEEYIDIDNENGVITGVASGTAVVEAIHNDLDMSLVFNVVCFSNNLYINIFSSHDKNSSGSYYDFGHSFLTFYNDTNSTLTIGHMEVAPKTEISISGWGDDDRHKGLWYNRDLYCIHKKNWFKDRVSLTEIISVTDDLDLINTYINDNDDWTLLENCSTFAANVWNLVSTEQVSAGWIDTPHELKEEIKTKTNYELCKYVQETSYYGYYDSNGNFQCKWGTMP